MPALIDPSSIPIGPRCSSCPSPYPVCGGQTNPNLCADDNGLITPRDETGKTISSILYGWPSPYPASVTGDGSGGGGISPSLPGGGGP